MSQLPVIKYFSKKCSNLSKQEIEACSDLFSNNYGFYSKTSGPESKRGKQIKLSPNRYNSYTENDYSYVALAYADEKLVGHAFYVVDATREGNITWVTQLVVHKNFRKQGIAKKLLFSVWGFSNDSAWGLATTNPLTIKTLESATMRKVDLIRMQKRVNDIKRISKKVSFVKEDNIFIDSSNSVVFSEYYVAHDDIPSLIKSYEKSGKWIFGDLEEGYEWLAFTFKNQDLKEISKKDLDDLFSHSEACLVDAYSRMKMGNQNWTKHTDSEVDFIEKYIVSKESRILDLGCGIGRHTAELYKRGYKDISAVDFSENNIKIARQTYPEVGKLFSVQDVRTLKSKKADLILCLYDVIGSFPVEKENLRIVKSIKRNLRKGGIAIISVMNMELTRNIAKEKNIFDVYKNPKKLFKLKASSIMQNTGDVFNPEFYVIDTSSNLVFRKEMFCDDGYLNSEYIIRDKRYELKEISDILEKNGLRILENHFVQAGNWTKDLKNTDLKAKEILLVVQR